MRVVFMGTPDFAVPSLRALLDRHDVVGVYTRPDQPTGRGRRLTPSPVKAAALDAGVPVFQPATFRDDDAVEELRSLVPEVVCVAAYGLILPPVVLAIPPSGCLNVHASLLPRFRGAAPVHRAILEGDEVAGVSIMRMEEGLDTGPYSVVRSVDVEESNVDELTARLAKDGADALLEALDALASGGIVWTDQDESLVTYAEKIRRSDVALDPDQGVIEASRRVRASSRSAPTRVSIGDKRLTVVRAVPHPGGDITVGSVSTAHGRLSLGFRDGSLELSVVRPEGRGDMPGESFLRGARLEDGCAWAGQE